MSKREEEEVSPKGVLTKEGHLRASNFILDLLRPKGTGQGYKKDAVTFIRDPLTGHIREVGTGKNCEVRWLERHKRIKPEPVSTGENHEVRNTGRTGSYFDDSGL